MSLTKLAAAFLGISGVLHLVGPALAGFQADTLVLLAFGMVYLILAVLLARSGSRGLCWLMFFVMIFGAIAAMTMFNSGIIANWVALGIVAANWCCAICLFLVLWRSADSVEA